MDVEQGQVVDFGRPGTFSRGNPQRLWRLRKSFGHAAGPRFRRDRKGRLLVKSPTDPPWPIIDRQALHARAISFDHPITGESLTIEAAMPHDLQRVLREADV